MTCECQCAILLSLTRNTMSSVVYCCFCFFVSNIALSISFLVLSALNSLRMRDGFPGDGTALSLSLSAGSSNTLGSFSIVLSTRLRKNSGWLDGLKSHDLTCDESRCSCVIASHPVERKGQATCCRIGYETTVLEWKGWVTCCRMGYETTVLERKG